MPFTWSLIRGILRYNDTCTNMKKSTKSVCSVSDVAQHVCDSGVSLACCGLQLAAVQQLPACEDELAQKGLTDWAGHCSYPLLEGLNTIFPYSVNILQTLSSWWEKISPAYFNPGEGVGIILQQHLYLWSFIYQSLKPIQCAVSCITRGRKRDHSGEQLTL